jgi:hypothetical protein
MRRQISYFFDTGGFGLYSSTVGQILRVLVGGMQEPGTMEGTDLGTLLGAHVGASQSHCGAGTNKRTEGMTMYT